MMAGEIQWLSCPWRWEAEAAGQSRDGQELGTKGVRCNNFDGHAWVELGCFYLSRPTLYKSSITGLSKLACSIFFINQLVRHYDVQLVSGAWIKNVMRLMLHHQYLPNWPIAPFGRWVGHALSVLHFKLLFTMRQCYLVFQQQMLDIMGASDVAFGSLVWPRPMSGACIISLTFFFFFW